MLHDTRVRLLNVRISIICRYIAYFWHHPSARLSNAPFFSRAHLLSVRRRPPDGKLFRATPCGRQANYDFPSIPFRMLWSRTRSSVGFHQTALTIAADNSLNFKTPPAGDQNSGLVCPRPTRDRLWRAYLHTWTCDVIFGDSLTRLLMAGLHHSAASLRIGAVHACRCTMHCR